MGALLFIAQTIRIAIPYLFAAAGGALAERAGVVSLTLEGFMLGGAFGAVVGSYYAHSAWVGLVVGVAWGLALAGVHAVSAIRFKADQIVVGVAINLFTVGITRFFLQLAFGSSSNSPRVTGFGAEGVSGASGFLSNPLIWLGVLVMPVVWWIVQKTIFGLRVRAVGEHPMAAASVGVPVNRVRYVAVLASGALAALGGVYLALDQHQFTDSMTAGRGFIALAAVIVESLLQRLSAAGARVRAAPCVATRRGTGRATARGDRTGSGHMCRPGSGTGVHAGKRHTRGIRARTIRPRRVDRRLRGVGPDAVATQVARPDDLRPQSSMRPSAAGDRERPTTPATAMIVRT